MSEDVISEDDLQAYVDGRLDASHCALVEEHLEQNPEVAARIATYIEQCYNLRAAFGSMGMKPVLKTSGDLGQSTHQAARRAAWMVPAAAVLLALVVGGGGGWLTRGQMAPPPLKGIPALTQEAVANHLVYTEDLARPVELTADRQGDLVRWLSKRLKMPVKVPDLTSAGYAFLGGRLVATDHGPAALLMYQDQQGNRLTVFTRPMSADRKSTKTVPVSANGVHGFAWVGDGLGYSVLMTGMTNDLRNVADAVQRQVNST